jgi:hypothetical protein
MKAHYIPCMSDFNREAVILGGQKYLPPSISTRELLTPVYTILEEVKNVQTTSIKNNEKKITSFFLLNM